MSITLLAFTVGIDICLSAAGVRLNYVTRQYLH